MCVSTSLYITSLHVICRILVAKGFVPKTLKNMTKDEVKIEGCKCINNYLVYLCCKVVKLWKYHRYTAMTTDSEVCQNSMNVFMAQVSS